MKLLLYYGLENNFVLFDASAKGLKCVFLYPLSDYLPIHTFFMVIVLLKLKPNFFAFGEAFVHVFYKCFFYLRRIFWETIVILSITHDAKYSMSIMVHMWGLWHFYGDNWMHIQPQVLWQNIKKTKNSGSGKYKQVWWFSNMFTNFIILLSSKSRALFSFLWVWVKLRYLFLRIADSGYGSVCLILGHKRHWSFLFAVSLELLTQGEASLHYMRIFKQPVWGGTENSC